MDQGIRLSSVLNWVTSTVEIVLLQGKAVNEAAGIKNSDIAKELSLPPVKLHCSSKLSNENKYDNISTNYFKTYVLYSARRRCYQSRLEGLQDETGGPKLMGVEEKVCWASEGGHGMKSELCETPVTH